MQQSGKNTGMSNSTTEIVQIQNGYKEVPITTDALINHQRHTEEAETMILVGMSKKPGQYKQMQNSMNQMHHLNQIKKRLQKKLSDRKKRDESA